MFKYCYKRREDNKLVVESIENENNDKLGTNLTRHCLFYVHRNQTKEDDEKHWLVVVFFRCIETKQKKMPMNISSSLSSLGAQKQNKTKQDDNER
jgi:hypothetical protein